MINEEEEEVSADEQGRRWKTSSGEVFAFGCWKGEECFYNLNWVYTRFQNKVHLIINDNRELYVFVQ